MRVAIVLTTLFTAVASVADEVDDVRRGSRRSFDAAEVEIRDSWKTDRHPSPQQDSRTNHGAAGGGASERVPPARPPEKVSPRLALADLEAMALANNPTLARAAALRDAAIGAQIQAGLAPNPVLGIVSAEIGSEGQAGQHGIFIRQRIVRGGKLNLSRSVAAREVQRAEQEMAAQQFRVLTDVRGRFYDVLVAESARDLAQQIVDVADEAVDVSKRLQRALELSRVDVLQANDEAHSASLFLDESEHRYQAAWRSLAAVAGMPDLRPTALSGDITKNLPLLDYNDALSQLQSNSPQLAASMAAVARARWAVRRASAEPIPDLEVQANVQYDDETSSTFAGVELAMQLPLYDRNQGAVRAARAELSASQAEVARLQLELGRRLADTFERYDNALHRVMRYQSDVLPNADETLQLVRTGYRQGEFNFLRLLTAQRTFFRRNLEYVQALRELHWAATSIEGLLLTDGLAPAGNRLR